MSQEKEKNALGIEASIEDLFEQKARPFEECPREKNDKTKKGVSKIHEKKRLKFLKKYAYNRKKYPLILLYR